MNAIQFGGKEDQFEYVDRPGAYAVIINDKNEIGVVENNGLYFLPGGGIENGENEEDAVLREVREETGISVKIDRFLGNSNEYLVSFDKAVKFNQIGFFYKCKIDAIHHHQSDASHVIKWMDFHNIKPRIARRSHLWALNLSLNGLDQFEIGDEKGLATGRYRLIRDNARESKVLS